MAVSVSWVSRADEIGIICIIYLAHLPSGHCHYCGGCRMRVHGPRRLRVVTRHPSASPHLRPLTHAARIPANPMAPCCSTLRSISRYLSYALAYTYTTPHYNSLSPHSSLPYTPYTPYSTHPLSSSTLTSPLPASPPAASPSLYQLSPPPLLHLPHLRTSPLTY
jgi:hypothetical protein